MNPCRRLPCTLAVLLVALVLPPGTRALDCNHNLIQDFDETQVTFVQKSIWPSSARYLAAGDLDGDGDRDLLAQSGGLQWFENVDGEGSFGAAHVIATDGGTADAVDVDGDGDLDVLSAIPAQVRWFENLDGGGTFGGVRVISEHNAVQQANSAIGADLDGDGDLDVVSSFWGQNLIVWFENHDGAGSFGPMRVITTILTQPTPVFLADLDGDDDLDVLGSGSTSDVGWLENVDGAGTFGPVRYIDIYASIPNEVVAADLDGDGDQDAIAANSDGEVRWYRNDGAGDFGSPALITILGNTAEAIAPADLDGDGDLDVLAMDRYSSVYTWLRNTDGLGSFEFGGALNVSGAIGDDVLAADLDGDGDVDVATGTSERLAWQPNGSDDCNGNRVPDTCDVGQGASPDCDGNVVPDSCDVGVGNRPDCNGNAVPDACDLAGGTSDDCDADARPDECQADCNVNGQADTCDVLQGTSEDCDADARPDECQADCNVNGQADTCDILQGTSEDCDADARPDECQADCNANGVADPCDLADGMETDCDGNGVPDACDTAGGADCNANGVPDACDTTIAFTKRIVAQQSGIASMAAADVDSDGDLDVVAASPAGIGRLAWYENIGDGTYSSERLIGTAGGARSVFPADVDGDGDPDLLVAATEAGDPLLWRNLGGVFGAPETIDFPSGPIDLVSTHSDDLDQDGDLDTLWVDKFNNLVAWVENLDGLGTFGPRRVIFDGQNISSGVNGVFTADLDGDADPDVLVSESGGYGPRWHENLDGAGTFGSYHVFGSSVATPSYMASAADLDGDSDTDVLAVGNDKLVWFENTDGAGGFGQAQLIDIAPGMKAARVADLDGDGDRDIVSAASGIHRVAWHENLGSGTFGPPRPLSSAAAWASAVLVADLSGDGFLDVFHAGEQAFELASYERVPVDCNGNHVPDECDADCNGNQAPDECELGCPGGCDTDGDGCLDPLDAAPDDPEGCADIEADGCDDCATGTFAPEADGPDADADGHCNAGDCDDSDETLWSAPGPARELALQSVGTVLGLTWEAPPALGALEVRYDVLRSDVPWDFATAAECIESDDADTGALDPEPVAIGILHCYLVRVENGCPGNPGTLGTDSAGAPRAGRDCP